MGNEDQIGGFDLICKGKVNKNNHIFVQKMSFLGTYNNRMENLKKMGKNCGSRLNTEYAQKLEQTSKLSSNNTNTVNSSHASKRNIINTRKIPRPGPPRDFVVKQKVKKEMTNENDPR